MLQVTRIGGTFNTQVSVRDKDLEKCLDKEDCEALCCYITLPPTSPLGSFQIIQDTITFYKCNISLKVSPPKRFLKYRGCDNSNNVTIFFRTQDQDDPPSSLAECPRVQLPVNMLAFSPDPFTFIASEFSINIVGFEEAIYNRVDALSGFGVGLGILLLAIVLCFGLYKQKQSTLSHVRLRSRNHYPKNDADPDGGRLFFGVPIFSYMELQDATNNFDPSYKLGDGGFGSVYYGSLKMGVKLQ
ncbi:hypothetical protein K1719_008874 [Acacia pycnantha]|nr:hypothetical protein K1719_008874 [Acacia pycnantha]